MEFNKICTDTFWDWNLTWGNHRPYPEFTECFQSTIILPLPSVVLFLSAPLYLYCVGQYVDGNITRSWKYWTKISVIIAQLSVRYLQLQHEEPWSARHTALLVEASAIILLLFYTDIERRKGFVTSGIQTIFWFLTSICGLVLLYSKMMRQDYHSEATGVPLDKSYLTLSVVQFVFTWFPDVQQGTVSESECKLATSSFIQRLLFTWLNGFMAIGKKRPVQESDFSDLLPSERTEVSYKLFENTWKAEQEKVDHVTRDSGTRQRVGLFKVLLKSYWQSVSGLCIITIFINTIFFISKPIIVGMLVEFATDKEQPLWKGYIYLTTGIVMIFMEKLLNNFRDYLSVRVAIRVDTCLKKFIFKKAMKLSNKARAGCTTGEISNLVSQDCRETQEFIGNLYFFYQVPLRFLSCVLLLFYTVSYAAFACIAILILVMPFNLLLVVERNIIHQQMHKKDERVKLMTEILNGIKILKLYAWEMAFGDKLINIRNEELLILRKRKIFDIITHICYLTAPFMSCFCTFAMYVYISPDHMLSPKIAFQSLATFVWISRTFNNLPHLVKNWMNSKAGIQRIQKFLNHDELDATVVSHDESKDAIQIENGTFTWDERLGPCLKDINISIPKGSLVAIVGSVGAGKSSLISAMLGEIDKDKGKVTIDGRIAYVSQQAWIFNDTLRNNVLFGDTYRKTIYDDVIDSCSLRRDLDILIAEDQTEIGEKGINLSGGQKQRVNIARAVYFNADIYLLDDPLSAVDAHVGKDIFEHVISENGLLKNKTRVLVTHGITMLPRMDKIICVEDGRIMENGTYEELIANEGAFARFILKHKRDDDCSDTSEDDENSTEVNHYGTDFDSGLVSDITDGKNGAGNVKAFKRSISRAYSVERKRSAEHDVIHGHKGKLMRMKSFDDKFKLNEKRINKEQDKSEAGKIIEEDELESGEVKWKFISPYFKAIGMLMCAVVLIFFTVQRLCDQAKNYWLKQWTSDTALSNLTSTPSDSQLRYDRNDYYIKLYLLLGIFHFFVSIIQQVLIMTSVLRGAKAMHNNMLTNILRGPMSFFDTIPVGRIVHRFSSDLDPLDYTISNITWMTLDCIYTLVSIFVVLFTTIPKFFVIVIPLVILYYDMKSQYVPIKRQVSRLRSKNQVPYFSHLTESLNGVHVIRAYGMVENFTQQATDKCTSYSKTRFHDVMVDRWLDLRLNLINVLCFAVSGYFAINDRETLGAALVGLIINYALDMSGNLQMLLKMSGEMQRTAVSIERIGQYTSSKQEAPLHTSIKPKNSWPKDGRVDIENYSMRYRDGLELVLTDINVKVTPGEKVGIVGRTGAGKSSLTLALFRLIEPATGKITIDNHDISELGLFDLRSNLTILPQEPVLFSGTLKSNLDPLNAFTDKEIYHALKHAHLKSFINSLPDTLNYECGEGGRNLSVGQRQLICLARSLLRKSHVLILDEATAAVDMETDALIQETIKQEFKECTVLTIAHRLNTILYYDRVMVLDQGKVTEFDSPRSLLENKNSTFYSMARDAGLVK